MQLAINRQYFLIYQQKRSQTQVCWFDVENEVEHPCRHPQNVAYGELPVMATIHSFKRSNSLRAGTVTRLGFRGRLLCASGALEPSRGVPDRHRGGGSSATVLRQRAHPADYPEEGEGTDRREVVQPT